MHAGDSQQRKPSQNTLKPGSGRICWPAGEAASSSSVSCIGSIAIKLAYRQTKSLPLLIMLIKKPQLHQVINNFKDNLASFPNCRRDN